MNVRVANYHDFLAVVAALGHGWVVFYWDSISVNGMFRIDAVSGKRVVRVALRNQTVAPETFATDFPDAIAVTGEISYD